MPAVGPGPSFVHQALEQLLLDWFHGANRFVGPGRSRRLEAREIAATGRLWIVWVTVALTAAGLASTVGAVNPTDDDAGSGMDAGDTEEGALEIDEGSYTGTLTNPIDARDQYVFETDGGEVLSLGWENPDEGVGIVNLYTPDGRKYTHDLTADRTFGNGEAEEYILAHPGMWRLEFEVSEVSAGPAGYGFSIALDEPTIGAVAGGGDSRAATVEARLTEPTDVFIQGWSSVASNESQAFAGRVHATYEGYMRADTDDPEPIQGSSGFYVYRSAAGEQVRIAEGPNRDLDLHGDEGADGLEWLNRRSFLPGFRGTIHGISYVTTGDGDMVSGVWTLGGNGPSGTASSGTSDHIVHWTSADVPADTKVVAPGVSAVGPWEQSTQLNRSFAGVFDTNGAGALATNDSAGWVEGPPGASPDTFQDSYILNEPEPGTWTFHVNNTNVGTGARSFLTGAFTPDLGIWNGVLAEEGPDPPQ